MRNSDQHVMSVSGTKKKSVSPTGFKPLTSQTLGERSIHLSYGELMEIRAKPYTRFIFDMHPAYCLRISNVDDAMCGERMKDGLNFKLSETNVKMKWSACHECGTEKISESPTGFEPVTF